MESYLLQKIVSTQECFVVMRRIQRTANERITCYCNTNKIDEDLSLKSIVHSKAYHDEVDAREKESYNEDGSD